MMDYEVTLKLASVRGQATGSRGQDPELQIASGGPAWLGSDAEHCHKHQWEHKRGDRSTNKARTELGKPLHCEDGFVQHAGCRCQFQKPPESHEVGFAA